MNYSTGSGIIRYIRTSKTFSKFRALRNSVSSPSYTCHMNETYLHEFITCKVLLDTVSTTLHYISRKNDWPLQEACTLVIDVCEGQIERPNISAKKIDTFRV